MRKSLIGGLLFVTTFSLGALAWSLSAHGVEKKTLHVLSESYKGYNSSHEGLDPKLWSFMQ